MLALLKMRVPYEAAVEMDETEAVGYIEAWLEISGSPKKKVYQVRKYHTKRK